MSRPAFRYLRTRNELRLDGCGDLSHDSGFAAPLDAARPASLSSLANALARYADNYREQAVTLHLTDVPAERFNDEAPIASISVEWTPRGLRLLVDVPLTERPSDPARVVGPLLRRHRAEIESVSRSDLDDVHLVEFILRLSSRGRTVGDWYDIGFDVQALLSAAESGDLSPDAAIELIRAGRVDLLVGHQESEWLEAKSRGYADGVEDKVELAKDVASFANAAGGLIVLGLKTKRRGEADVIQSVNEVPLDLARPRTIRQRLARHLFPTPEGLVIEQVSGSSPARGVTCIFVPAQPSGRKPFVVSGAIVGRKTQGAFVTITTRVGADTEHIDIRTLHAQVRAGQRALEGVDGGVRQAIWRDTMPPLIAQTVRAAEHAGFVVDVGPSTAVFRLPDGREVTTQHAGLIGVTEDLELQRVLVELARLGFPVRRTRRGGLMPAVHLAADS